MTDPSSPASESWRDWLYWDVELENDSNPNRPKGANRWPQAPER